MFNLFDSALWQIVGVSLQVSVVAVTIATLIALPLAAWLAVSDFVAKRFIVLVLNSLMAAPSVVVGVVVYLLLSRGGLMGSLGWLFSIQAMIIAQIILTLPLIAALARQVLADSYQQHHETMRSFRLPLRARIYWILLDVRFSLIIVVLLGFSRAISEVGAVMIVGGNINGVTRTMTTAIALETAKGELYVSLFLGAVLLLIVLLVNFFVARMQWRLRQITHALPH